MTTTTHCQWLQTWSACRAISGRGHGCCDGEGRLLVLDEKCSVFEISNVFQQSMNLSLLTLDEQIGEWQATSIGTQLRPRKKIKIHQGTFFQTRSFTRSTLWNPPWALTQTPLHFFRGGFGGAYRSSLGRRPRPGGPGGSGARCPCTAPSGQVGQGDGGFGRRAADPVQGVVGTRILQWGLGSMGGDMWKGVLEAESRSNHTIVNDSTV